MRAARAADFFDAARWAGLAWDVWLGRWSDPKRIEARAQQRLRNLIAHARRACPLYRDLYAPLARRAAAALTDLPVVTKQLVMSNFDAAVADPQITRAGLERFCARTDRLGEPYLGRYAVWTSSGTSGESGWFVHDGDALAVYEALEMFRFRGLRTPADFAARLAAGERYALVAATGGHFAGVATVEHLRRSYPWLAPSVQSFSLLQPLSTLVEQLNAYRPALLATYPTAAEVLADEAEAGRLRVDLREIWTGGECLHAPVRERLQRVFGCRVRNGYGASEFLSIAWECGHGALHVNADWVLLEPVDAQHRPVPPGVASASVLLTNLANRALPLIRYDLGDSITVHAEPCACGSPFPAIAVEGRHDDVLRFAGARGAPPVKVLPLVITTVLEEVAGVHDFQLVQTGPRTLRLLLGRGEQPHAAQAKAALAAYLMANGGARATIEVADAPPIRSSTSGKLRRVVRLRWSADC
ncbi:MAG: phenylacetate--CoA ligase family protein [Betaproteobacteria bacterium]